MIIEGEIPLNDREFDRVRTRLYGQAGISLSDAKRTLVITRLSKIVRQRGLATFDQYLDFLERGATALEAQEFVNALTTNLTRFWREEHHFTHLIDYVRGLMATRTRETEKRLRIWSAGCSTGQEPYTIALGLLDALPELKRWDLRILATDIDTSVIAKAATAIYPDSELNGLPVAQQRLFERRDGGRIAVPRAAASLVSFKPLNLMLAPWPMRGPFDAIFCRNVTIYFDKPTQGEVFSRLGRILVPGGFLYIGHSESLGTASAGFRSMGKTIYQSRSEAGQQPARARTRDAA
jgi:chemotaxis protein methyltransferase CheR